MDPQNMLPTDKASTDRVLACLAAEAEACPNMAALWRRLAANLRLSLLTDEG